MYVKYWNETPCQNCRKVIYPNFLIHGKNELEVDKIVKRISNHQKFYCKDCFQKIKEEFEDDPNKKDFFVFPE